MVTGMIGERCGGLAELDDAEVPARRPLPMHYVVVRQGDEGLEVLCISLKAKGEVFPVFSVGWAARAYLFAEASDKGWYAKACDADEIISLLDSLRDRVEWVALDASPDRQDQGEVANVMPRESFVDYLSCFHNPASLLRGVVEAVEDEIQGADNG